MAATSKPAAESISRESASKMEVPVFYNVFVKMISCHLCHSLLLRSKSQILPKLKGGKKTVLNKGVNLRKAGMIGPF